MELINYKDRIRELGAKKSLGQNFLINKEIARLEAKYAEGMNVLEMGCGLGILTAELCETAKKVISIEKDERLFYIVKREQKSKKLLLIKDDFFSADIEKLKPIDIMVSNIPYNLSSKVIYWLSLNEIRAVLCVQKEFAEHMLAKPGTKEYSKLSVISSLKFKLHYIRTVSSRNFYPMPKVDSSIIYLLPTSREIDNNSIKTLSLLMNHKKKRLKNAIIDSCTGFEITKPEAKQLSEGIESSDSRAFQLEPEKLLQISEQINRDLEKIKRNS